MQYDLCLGWISSDESGKFALVGDGAISAFLQSQNMCEKKVRLNIIAKWRERENNYCN